MKRVFSIAALMCFLLSVQCQHESSTNIDDNTGPEVNNDITVTQELLVESGNKFAFKIFKALNEQEPNSNICISPMSMSMALGMTMNGAVGSTKEGMEQALEYSDMEANSLNETCKNLLTLLGTLDPEVVMELANSIWYRTGEPVLSEFKNINREYFNAEIAALDFNSPDAPQIINNWVEENTNGKIKDMVPDPIDGTTVMILLNTIYFKAFWTSSFDPDKTSDQPFGMLDGTQKQCNLMQGVIYISNVEDSLFTAVEMFYGNGQFSMILILPKGNETVNTLIPNLSPDNLPATVDSFLYKTKPALVYLPKFKFEYEKKLNDILISLGMADAFSLPPADFSNITGKRDLFISLVKHKTFIELNETGTEAAAATLVATGKGPSPPVFRFNRPFLFVIRENMAGSIIFMGKVVDPVYN
jgi:serpin B